MSAPHAATPDEDPLDAIPDPSEVRRPIGRRYAAVNPDSFPGEENSPMARSSADPVNGAGPTSRQWERVHRGVTYRLSPAHPLADLFPWGSEDELDEMAAEIGDPQTGQKHPIDILPDGRILDGRSRELACRIAGANPRYNVVRIPESAIPAFIKAKNLSGCTRAPVTTSRAGGRAR